jgi:hypothetical protein
VQGENVGGGQRGPAWASLGQCGHAETKRTPTECICPTVATGVSYYYDGSWLRPFHVVAAVDVGDVDVVDRRRL